MKIAIIGGGAAGMMCAATINELNPRGQVFLIEKNDSLGKKVIISGGGRCNVTTGFDDLKIVLSKYPRGEKFLISAMTRFSPTAVYQWFEDHGVPLKCETDMRVFPQSDDGHDVVGAFQTVFAKSKTKLLLEHTVKQLEKKDGGFSITFKNGETLVADRVVLALGGQAYRQTGSSGDGYTLAESLGHHITPLAPSLHSFITKEKWPKSISGLSFAEAEITVSGQKKYSFTGPFLFTHSGISGPAVFALSSLSAFEVWGPTASLPIFINLAPALNSEELLEKLKQNIAANPKKVFKNSLFGIVPQSIAELVCQENAISLEKKNAELSTAELTKVAKWLQSIPLHAVGRGSGDEFVTAGGVETSEIDPKTMASKLCPGLYFAGEIINVDGFTGGYNLQASWATGHAAGESIAQSY